MWNKVVVLIGDMFKPMPALLLLVCAGLVIWTLRRVDSADYGSLTLELPLARRHLMAARQRRQEALSSTGLANGQVHPISSLGAYAAGFSVGAPPAGLAAPPPQTPPPAGPSAAG
ncbi:MAG: hypothetical protein LBH68_04125 [Bifidobacteriaceae bacterium]|jgi:hypothetical protein|nr:hypothetical protein [Bifidobacteriaceae bacterium]